MNYKFGLHNFNLENETTKLLKTLLAKYKLVIRFIATFLLVYLSLSVAYKFYLQFSDGGTYFPDFVTHTVSNQSKFALQTLGYDVKMLPHPDEPSIKVILNGNYLARVIEGCNAISVTILFASFIVAFASQFKSTFLYIIFGSVLIYVVNLVRIVLLTLGIYHYPNQKEILHSVVFPGIIYGLVFILWIFWVNRFSKLKTNNE